PRAEDQRVTLLSLVLLRIDVELLALHHSRTLDRLPHRAVDATDDHIDVILLNELRCLDLPDAICGFAVLEVQLDLSAQQTTRGIDVVDHHPRHVRVGDTHERKGTRLVCDHADLDPTS